MFRIRVSKFVSESQNAMSSFHLICEKFGNSILISSHTLKLVTESLHLILFEVMSSNAWKVENSTSVPIHSQESVFNNLFYFTM